MDTSNLKFTLFALNFMKSGYRFFAIVHGIIAVGCLLLLGAYYLFGIEFSTPKDIFGLVILFALGVPFCWWLHDFANYVRNGLLEKRKYAILLTLVFAFMNLYSIFIPLSLGIFIQIIYASLKRSKPS